MIMVVVSLARETSLTVCFALIYLYANNVYMAITSPHQRRVQAVHLL